MLRLLKAGLLALAIALIGSAAHAQAQAQSCPSPNPNLTNTPFDPRCPVPVNALNQLLVGARDGTYGSSATCPQITVRSGRIVSLINIPCGNGGGGGGGNISNPSPALTGIPTAPTAAPGTNTGQIATTAFVLANSAASGVTGSGTPGFAALWNGPNSLGQLAVAFSGPGQYLVETNSGLISPSLLGGVPASALSTPFTVLGSTSAPLGGTTPTIAGLTLTTPTIASILNGGTLTVPGTTGTLLESAGVNTVTGTLNVSGTFQIGGTNVGIPISVVAGGTGLSVISANAIYKGNGTSPPTASALSDNGNFVLTAEPIDLLTTQSVAREVANAAVTGTTNGLLAKYTGAPTTAVRTATTDTDGAVGVVVGGGGTTGNAQIATIGFASCTFDGATTAGHFVSISGTVAGNCHDAGASRPTAIQTVGQVMATIGSAGPAIVDLSSEFTNAAGSGGISGLTTGQVGVAGSASTLTSSVPFGLTGNSTLVQTTAGGLITNSLISALPNSSLANTTVTFAGQVGTLGGASVPIAATNLSNETANTIIGNNTGSPAPPAYLTPAQVSTLMGLGTMSTQNSSAVSITGGTITGTGVTGLATPVGTTDAANKSYVDAAVSGANLHAQADAATPGAVLPNTPTASGTGVGKTLTSATNTALVVDGYTVLLNNRVLVKDQAAPADNGIYKQTQLGTGSVPWILTRATDFDQAVAGEVALGAFMLVANGTVNANTQWQLGAPTPAAITVDTTALTFNKLNASTVYTADGTTLQLIGNQFSALPSGILNAVSGTVNSLLYKSGANWAGIAPVNNAVLVTSAGGVPSESATLPSGLTIPGYLQANQTITLSGDATGSGTTAITTTVGKVNGVTYPASPATNTTAIVTSANTTTYEQVPTAAIANSAVTYPKIQNEAAMTVLGNSTGSPAAPAEVPLGATGNSTVVMTTAGGLLTNSLISALPFANLATMADGTLLANIAGTIAVPVASSLSAILDHDIASVQGDILYRNATTWVALAPGTAGQFLQTGGAAANPLWATPATGGSGTVNSGTALHAAYYATTGTAVSSYNNLLFTTNSGSAPLLLFNLNAAAAPATLAQVQNVGVDGGQATIENDAFQNGTPTTTSSFVATTFGGTGGSPVAVLSGASIGSFAARAYDGASTANSVGAIRCFAAENQSVGHHGAYCSSWTTPAGSTTLTEVMRWEQDGGITTAGVTGGDKGLGTVNAGGLFVNGTAVSTTTVAGGFPQARAAITSSAIGGL